MNDIMNIGGIDCYEKDGTAYLKLEAVARGLGFTKSETKNGTEYTSIRWETVFRYLEDIGFANKLAKDDFIPENIFYRLAMKAKNEAAERFQAKIADEVIPAIRRHGAYMTPETLEAAILNPDTMIRLCTALKEEQDKRDRLELENAQQRQIIGELKPLADYTSVILQNPGLVTITQIAKDYGMSGRAMNRLLAEKGVQYKQSGQWLLYQKYHDKGYTHSKTIDIVRTDGTKDVRMETKWTQKGRLFLYELLKADGILPVIERDMTA